MKKVLEQVGAGVVMGVLIFGVLALPMLEIYCTEVLNSEHGFIGCAVGN